MTVVARAPLRVSLGGGGTDLPSHYERHGGFVVSAAIDSHVHIEVGPAQGTRYELDHLERESVDDAAEIRHPLLRAAIARHADGRPLRLASRGDVAPGTGLGSSGAYTVCAVAALERHGGRSPAPGTLAEAACAIELDDVGRTVGKQDQYAAAFGGVNAFEFGADGSVDRRALELPASSRAALRERFLLFSTGQSRSAAEMLATLVTRSAAGDRDLQRNLRSTAELARESARALEAGDLAVFGELMNAQWELKRERLPAAPTDRSETLRECALAEGAEGAILTGAGGGGYVLAYASDPERVRAAMSSVRAPELPFDVEPRGCVAEA